ncbi:hypothetical protein GIB67_034892 [Kingdonia uniflora]|uniref:Uncharacterized protein n=1 Tax=Kingdonia uniflora TaxID=39325 RepID=A0A7J7KVX1_9MAGN|nr:hypothetical protein GIB67_034892 [Kingdonia uniflora]
MGGTRRVGGCSSSIEGVKGPMQIDNLAGLPSIDIPCKPLANMKEGEKSVSLEAKVEYGTRVKKQLEFDLVGSSIKEIDLPKLGTKRSTFRGIIDISDNEDEDEDTPKQSNFRRNGATCVSSDHTTVGMRSAKSLKVVDLELDVESGSNSDELPLTRTPKRKRAHNVVSTDSEDDIDNTPTSTSNLRDKGNTCLSGNPTMVEMNSRACLKRIHLNQEDEGKGSSCGEFPLTRTPRRKRAPNLTDSEDEDKDKVHIRKLLKTKRLEELTDGVDIARESLPSTHPTLTFGNAHAKDFASPSRPRLTPLRKCKEKIGGERSLSNSLEKIGPSHKKSEILTCEDSEESEGGEVRLDVNNENMNGFIVDSSEDTEDTDSDDAGVDWREIISKLGSKSSNKLNWEYEADMLASFEVDPEPCMRAVCALYRQQTSEEKSIKGSLHHNNRGFNRYDALRGTTLAEFLLGGDRDGDLKKSAEELKKHDPLGIQECNRMARHYSKQLFSIYRNKEDPYFLASS